MKELAKGQHQKKNSKPALTASAGQGWMLVAKVASVTLMLLNGHTEKSDVRS